MHSNAYKLAAVLIFLLLAGCSLAPRYQQPKMPVADQLPTYGTEKTDAANKDSVTTDAAALGWSEFFSDPTLQQIIATALDRNRDLRQSALMVESYQAQYRIQRSALFPSVSATPLISRQRTFSGDNQVDLEIAAATVGITAYELDLFGRVRNLKEDTLEQYLAMAETYRSARLSLVAEVARAYLTLLADRELLAITEETFSNESESYNIIEDRMREGIANQLELAQARTSLENARGNLAQYRRQAAQDLNNLALLTGATEQELQIDADSLKLLQPMAELPSQLPSQVLLQRPDIMAAEHVLKGANASIGAARAAFFPNISLTANVGYMSADLGRMFSGGSETWLFSPNINVPIFTAGRLRAELDVAELRRDISVAGYEKAIQTAFREVADSLVARQTYVEQLSAQMASLKANQDYYRMARDRYQQGLDSYLTMLDAQRSLYNSRQAYVATRLAQLVNQVTLYKVLGGGWKEKS
jgi:multidrug efflux system outer membrane protein